MKTLVAAVLALALGGSAFAAPECAVYENGQLVEQAKCIPYEPLDPSSYETSIRCMNYKGVNVSIDHRKWEKFWGANIVFMYLDKFGDDMILNQVASQEGPPLDNPVFENQANMELLIPRKANGQLFNPAWEGKSLSVRCTMKD